ncbi:MAG: hypothetical protein DRQ41_12110 [Gammaproteobacteria bacterium]|nr:MAG: hypothetical protein DRQ41_12110 [Gammaproteobacteria bacterium]
MNVDGKKYVFDKEESLTILRKAKRAAFGENENYTLSVFRDTMDRLHEIGTVEHQRLFNREMPKSDGFHMPLTTADSSVTTLLGGEETNADDVRAVYASPGMFERRTNNRAVEIFPISKVIETSTQSMANFVYTDSGFSRAQELLNSPAFKTSISSKYHPDYLTFLQHGIARWSGKTMSKSAGIIKLDELRVKFGASVLTGNIELATQQLFSVPLYSIYVDSKYITQSMGEMALDLKNVEGVLEAWSTLYQSRGENVGSLVLDQQTAAIDARGYGRTSSTIEKIQGAPMKFTDKKAVTLGMYAGFLQFQDEVNQGKFSNKVRDAMDVDDYMIPHMSPEVVNQYAIRFGEYATERTQPNSDPQFTSDLQTETFAGRAFTQFGTFTNTAKDAMARTYHAMKRGDQGAVNAFRTTMIHLMLTLPGMMSIFKLGRTAVNEAIMGMEEEEKDPVYEKLAKNYIGSIGGYWFGVRDVLPLALGTSDEVRLANPVYNIVNVSWRAGTYFMKAGNNKYTEEERWRYMAKGLNESAKAVMMYNGYAVYFNNKLSYLMKRED